MIHADEHRSYGSLMTNGFIHETVCHKYNFVSPITGIHTQAIESFHNELKLSIKRRKRVKTNLREKFLGEFIWLFNNKNNLFQQLINLIKI